MDGAWKEHCTNPSTNIKAGVSRKVSCGGYERRNLGGIKNVADFYRALECRDLINKICWRNMKISEIYQNEDGDVR